ncbi:MAG TPA: cupredoxin domain-containing protein [Kofleriaceae bacterium]|nr:cupredoxin domain-containing protein [Kofleriaceae bacterium]
MEAPGTAPVARTVAITIGEHGFEPDRVEARAGEEVELVFTRRVEHTCVTRVVLSLDADRRIERDLPLDRPVVVRLSFDRPGELGFSCPMGMHAGVITIR